MLNSLKNQDGDMYIGLKWENTGNTTPSIRLFQSADTNGGLGHIKNAMIAAKQADSASEFSYCLTSMGTGVDQVRPGGRTADFIFSKSMFAELTGSQSKLHLLFEGVSEGKGELRLILLKRTGEDSWISLGECSSIWLDLKNIRRMYMRPTALLCLKTFRCPGRYKLGILLLQNSLI